VNEERKILTPFRSELGSKLPSGFESVVRKFKEDDRYLVKSPKEQPKALKSQEVQAMSQEEFLKERYKKAYQLLQQYLGDFIPKSNFLIGHGDQNPKSKIYIVQEKIITEKTDNLLLEKIIGRFPGDGDSLTSRMLESFKTTIADTESVENMLLRVRRYEKISEAEIQIARELDELVYRALRMWRESFITTENGPLIISSDRKLRYREKSEGILPEILNPRNIILGRKQNETQKKLYYVDNGVIGVPKSFMPPNRTNEFVTYNLRKLMIFFNTDRCIDKYYIQKYFKKPKEVDKIKDFLQSKAGNLYDQISRENQL
jgi:hypothetical protein